MWLKTTGVEKKGVKRPVRTDKKAYTGEVESFASMSQPLKMVLPMKLPDDPGPPALPPRSGHCKHLFSPVSCPLLSILMP